MNYYLSFGYLSNQGDAWEWTQNNLERALRDELADAMSEQEQHYNALGELKDFAQVLERSRADSGLCSPSAWNGGERR